MQAVGWERGRGLAPTSAPGLPVPEQQSAAVAGWVGRVLAGHRIDALIGEGGMGVVYRASHLQLRRTVALKVLAPVAHRRPRVPPPLRAGGRHRGQPGAPERRPDLRRGRRERRALPVDALRRRRGPQRGAPAPRSARRRAAVRPAGAGGRRPRRRARRGSGAPRRQARQRPDLPVRPQRPRVPVRLRHRQGGRRRARAHGGRAVHGHGRTTRRRSRSRAGGSTAAPTSTAWPASPSAR